MGETYQERVALASWVQLPISLVAMAIQTCLCTGVAQGHGVECHLPIPVWQWDHTEGVADPAG